MKAHNMPQSAIDEACHEGEFVLLADNWLSWVCFTRCSTQWRASNGRMFGLDHNAVDILLRRFRLAGKRLKRKLQDRLFGEINDYERGALQGWAAGDQS